MKRAWLRVLLFRLLGMTDDKDEHTFEFMGRLPLGCLPKC